jgi:hypothetical protein
MRGCSVQFHPGGFDQCTPVLEIVLYKLRELIRRQLDAFEAVGFEEFTRLRQVQNLGDVAMNPFDQIGRSPDCTSLFFLANVS